MKTENLKLKNTAWLYRSQAVVIILYADFEPFKIHKLVAAIVFVGVVGFEFRNFFLACDKKIPDSIAIIHLFFVTAHMDEEGIR